MADDRAMPATAEAIIAQLGVPHGLVLAAGVLQPGTLTTTTLSDWHRHLSVNATDHHLAVPSVTRADRRWTIGDDRK